MEELTKRQIQILKAVVDEYVETAKPVGSEVVEKKYTLGVSPATIRNEMVVLVEKGYLKQPFTSAGRVPTPKGLRFYVDGLMEEKKLSVTEEVAAKEKVWDARFDPEELVRQAVGTLAERTRMLAVGGLERGQVWHAGSANVLRYPEFFDIDVTAAVLGMVEEVKRMRDLFFERETEEPLEIIFGEELAWPYFEAVGMILARFKGKEGGGCLGVVGPARVDYPWVVPQVRYLGGLLGELLGGG